MRTHPDGSPRGPLTYLISYREGNTTNDAWAESLAAAPPDLLHHGHDVPFNNLWGPTAGYSAWEPDSTASPADVRRRVDELHRGIDRLHDLGVRWIIPYTNPSIIGGNHENDTGFFGFWRRKRDFAELGFDRVPDSEPMDWMQRNRFSFAPYKDDSPYWRYEPCHRRESWLRTLEIGAGLIAEAGYDGMFSDDDNVQCYCPQCVADFRAFLRSEFPDRVKELEKRLPLERTFPWSDDGQGTGPAYRRPTSGKPSNGPELRDGAPADAWSTLLWEASQEFWGQSVGDMLARFREAGRRHNRKFFVVANWGMSMTAKEFKLRRSLGHDVRRWVTGARWQMLEEGGSGGFVAPGLAADFWTPVRVMIAHGAEPALLAYTRNHPGQLDLQAAEIASACGGAWMTGGGRPELYTAYRRFFDDRAELFDGVEPFAPVGVVYSLEDILRNNDEHLRLVYAVSRALARSHVPYDIVAAANLRERKFAVLVNPGARAVPESHLAGVPTISLGPSGEPAESLLDPHEIDLDRVLDLPKAEQDATLRTWATLDLRRPAPLAERIARALGHDPSLTSDPRAHSVRLRAYTTRGGNRLIVHVVNYGCTSLAESIPVPGEAPSFRLLVPEAFGRPSAVWTEGPGVERESLAVGESGGRRSVDVPPTAVYRVVVLDRA